MNPTLDRLLARLRTRLAKTPLPGFFAWWGRELLACLPARWRAVLSERSEALLLDLRGEEVVVWREKGDAASEYARIRRDLPADAQAAEFRRLRDALDDPQVRTVFCIPAERVLTRVLSLPAAAQYATIACSLNAKQLLTKSGQLRRRGQVLLESRAGRACQRKP